MPPGASLGAVRVTSCTVTAAPTPATTQQFLHRLTFEVKNERGSASVLDHLVHACDTGRFASGRSGSRLCPAGGKIKLAQGWPNQWLKPESRLSLFPAMGFPVFRIQDSHANHFAIPEPAPRPRMLLRQRSCRSLPQMVLATPRRSIPGAGPLHESGRLV